MTQATPTTGAFCWAELGTTDAKKAKAFYTKLFGWRTDDKDMGEMGTYTLLKLGEHDVGGLYELSGPMFQGVPSHWMHYVSVADVDAVAGKVGKLGGKVVSPPMDIPDVGRMAVLEDAEGAKFSLFKYGLHQGATVDPMAPGAFCWRELHTREPKKAEAFYTKLLGWKAKHGTGPMEYTEWNIAGPQQPFGGMLRLDPAWGDAPPFWLGYVTVNDADATTKKAQSLGGTVLCPPMDIPGVGRFAVINDPTGASFAVIKLSLTEEHKQGKEPKASATPAAKASTKKK